MLAQNGYKIEQNPVVKGTTRKPDYMIEGELFDCYSPEKNTKVRNIYSNIEGKVTKKKQANRVILNLDDWAGEMSISVTGRIKEKKLNNDLYKKYILEYPLFKNIMCIEDNDFTYIGKNFGYEISYFEKKAPFNIWDSEILNHEYEYSQIIIFDLHKEIDYIEAYKSIIDFFVFLNKKIECEILVTSDVHNDICYINQDIQWSERWGDR